MRTVAVRAWFGSFVVTVAALSLGAAGCACDRGVCGDGLIQNEGCDDADSVAGDGCSALCIVEPGWTCAGQPSVCTMGADCGDGVCEATESCTSCEADCGVCPVCGDGTLDVGEECDDGNTLPGDGCGPTCLSEAPGCGDGTCDIAGGECTTCATDCAGDPGCGGVKCGNGGIDAGEDCDGAALGGASCASLGYASGTLACNVDCTYDETGCMGMACGNGTVDAGEDCDGVNLGGGTCIGLGYAGGTLACALDCTYDDTGCNDCGDGVIDFGEDCDGAALGGASCTTLGFAGGALACTAGCLFDTMACFTMTCGNGVVEGVEVCDGADLGGATCVTEGFTAGTLACVAGCGGFDTSGCTSCGNGVAEGTEACDGADLSGETCATQGFLGGTLACGAACAFDTSACYLVATCGNGVIEVSETCDDGGTVGGDGCNSTCQLEVPGLHEQLTGAADAMDLCGQTIAFSWSGTAYSFTVTSGVDVLPFAPGSGTVATTSLPLGDDSVETVALTTPIAFFGVTYTTMYVSMNGNVTFGSADGTFTESVAGLYTAGNPRAAAFWDDFYPGLVDGGVVTVDQFATSVVVTWEEVLPFGGAIDRSTFQAVFNTNSNVSFNYLNVGQQDGIIGLASGATTATPAETNFFTGTRSEGFHELFPAAATDLAGTTVRFTATPSLNGFAPTSYATGVAAFPDTAGTGTSTMALVLGDDATTLVTFPAGFTFPFFGTSRANMNVNSNGNITFGVGDTDFTETIAEFYDTPRVAPFWDDLNPGAGGTVTYDAFADRVVVTYNAVPLFSGAGTVSMQVALFNSGDIRMTWLVTATGGGLVGAASGTGAYPKCPMFRSDIIRDSDGVFELFTGAGGAENYDLAGDQVTFTPNPFAPGGYSYVVSLTGLVTFPTAPGTGSVSTAVLAGTSGCDDCTDSVDIAGFRFPFYDNRLSRLHVSSNGNITFGVGDATFGESIAGLLNPLARIAPFWDDLYPVGAGDVYRDEFANRIVITWNGVAPFATTVAEVWTQVELFNDGRIVVSSLGTLQVDALVGLSMGGLNPAVPIPEVVFQ